MSKFPLYSILNVGLPEKDLTAFQKNSFVAKIPTIDKSGRELLYALIRFYHQENNGINFYGGVTAKTSVTFDLEALPLPLKQLLYKFVLVHLKKMKEDTV
jgi:hypothetical protein